MRPLLRFLSWKFFRKHRSFMQFAISLLQPRNGRLFAVRMRRPFSQLPLVPSSRYCKLQTLFLIASGFFLTSPPPTSPRSFCVLFGRFFFRFLCLVKKLGPRLPNNRIEDCIFFFTRPYDRPLRARLPPSWGSIINIGLGDVERISKSPSLLGKSGLFGICLP